MSWPEGMPFGHESFPTSEASPSDDDLGRDPKEEENYANVIETPLRYVKKDP